jgi:5-methylcytosine-specific restriction protein A
MKIHDLPDPVTASKADWSIADTCISFTPNSASRDAKNKCQSSILKQFGQGYVLEYITQGFEHPNPGYEDDADYKADRERHEVFGGALVAVHRLQHSSLPLSTIYGAERYKHIQDMWARGGRRFRWDVAFPIVESYDIKDKPKAKTVFGQGLYETLYKRSSNGLRRLTDAHRVAIASLDIEPREVVPNRYIADDAADEREMLNKLYRDFGAHEVFRSALEGMTEDRKVKFRHRSVAALREQE